MAAPLAVWQANTWGILVLWIFKDGELCGRYCGLSQVSGSSSFFLKTTIAALFKSIVLLGYK
ncbi:MAG: hypothetical protein WBH03_00435 [Cyclobacteriaceae bacterium]